MMASSGEIQTWMSRLLTKVHFDDACIRWPYAKLPKGYGLYRRQYAHRFVLTHFKGGPVGERNYCAHSCGNPSCVNPKHLRWATPKENTLDKKLHGTWLEGESAPRAKLTKDDVITIFLDDRANSEIADQYGITPSNVSCIKRRKSWAKFTEHLFVDQRKLALERRRRTKREHKDAEAQKWGSERLLYEQINPNCERDECIEHLRSKGATLQAIGDVFSISRERVRQILT